MDLIGPYTLKDKDGSSIELMCLTMINLATSWFKIVELPTVAQETTVPRVGKGKKVTFAKKTKVSEPYLMRVPLKSVTWCIKPGLVDIHVVDT